ncbi:hypothetical protein SAMN05660690_1950 [Geodermatophilus telluris]|uniref:Uncharacterized protein n=1 Tax=Geodermatophilus telluris TaxID=1190417 RepID=A0A1G6MNI8_9ACTN|nr:hypothetical protein [Geodermatophilus telluris]SDC57062.1 hypothetical protein SAMN05660690_1950 [Geodermatophilus telluris]
MTTVLIRAVQPDAAGGVLGPPRTPLPEAAPTVRVRRGDVRVRARSTDTAAARDDVIDQWGRHSFPASDPPANW